MTTKQTTTAETTAPNVLVVDDEPTVLETLSHQLQRDYQVVTATDGNQALRLLATAPFAAVISDMRMPNMDGVTLLGHVREQYPDTTRVLHTAKGDLQSAIAAINDGQVFRYVTKPAGTSLLRATVRDAVALHQRKQAEREILDKTLRTSLQALFGCLELASPLAFARAGRIHALVGAICAQLALGDVWEIEVAAMASQLGAVTLPPSVLGKLDRGLPLPDDEQAMIDAMPATAAKLIGDIPMLEEVVAIVLGQQGPPRARWPSAEPPSLVTIGIDVLRAATEVEVLESRGLETTSAIAVMERDGGHLPQVLNALREVRQVASAQETVRAYPLVELRVGMRIVEDVLAVHGPVLIGRGIIVSAVLLERLFNYKRMGQLAEPILATVPVGLPVRPASGD